MKNGEWLHRWVRSSCGFIAVSLLLSRAYASDLTKLSLTELSETEISVTSVDKRPEKLSEAAAAIYVISHEDIRRSGVTNLPDALRMAPGVQVAQIDSSRWAISIRGFNSNTSNKLLILIDGRIVYSPLYAQTYWNAQDVVLEDVDRIEVIRGPGATLWGSNAVNGVINVIMLPAKNTQGNLLTGLAGKRENNTFSFRNGGQIGDMSYRVYGKTFRRDPFVDKGGVDSVDDWSMSQGGFRTDWQPSKKDTLTLQGDIYNGKDKQLTDPGFTQEVYSGANILARWIRTYSPSESLSIQTYYDKTNRDSAFFGEQRENYDAEILYNSKPAKNHSLVMGVTARRSVDEITERNNVIAFNPLNAGRNLFSFFAQDEIEFSKKFRLTLGNKFEHNDYTGWELQPTIRSTYLVEPNKTIWTAVSRAVRIPTRVDDDFAVSNTAFISRHILATLNLSGNKNFQSEIEHSYEIGYRYQPRRNLSFDLTAFYVDYTNLETIQVAPLIFTFGHPIKLLINTAFGNQAAANGRGQELQGTWTINDGWKLSGSYTRLILNTHNLDKLALAPVSAGESPAHQFEIHSFLNLSRKFEFDAMLNFVNAVTVPDYVRLDLRLGWHVQSNLELSLVAQNLFSGRHQEMASTTSTFVVPATFAKVIWRF